VISNAQNGIGIVVSVKDKGTTSKMLSNKLDTWYIIGRKGLGPGVTQCCALCCATISFMANDSKYLEVLILNRLNHAVGRNS